MQPKELVEKFIIHIRAQRFDDAKAMLAVESFEYVGPNMRFFQPDDFLSYQYAMAAIQKDIVMRHVSADGEHVFAVLDYQTYFVPIGDVRIAMWFVVSGDKIQKVEAFYNAAVVENMLDEDGKSALGL